MRRMCTMSWLREGGGYHVFFNRDERRTREPAEGPSMRTSGPVALLAPRDGTAGGSWLATNEFGLTVALLNGYLGADSASGPPTGEWTSRGHLVMELAAARDVDSLVERLAATDLSTYRSFHLVALDDHGERLAHWTDGRLTRDDPAGIRPPLVSSSFRFDEVTASRVAHYRETLASAGASPLAASLAYHRSHLPERGAYSPCMHRDDARTVSFTWIRVDERFVRMRYSPDAPCRGWPPGAEQRLERRD